MITNEPILDVKQYWIGSLISAAGGIIGSALGWGSQSSSNAANMELAKYKYDKDLEMWNRQNAYNTPAAQMQRYATAGINPNTVVSQGNNGNASSMPSFEAPELKPYTGFGDLGAGAASNQILGKMQLDNQVRGTESQVATNTALQNKYNAEAINTSQKTETEFWNSLHRAREYGILDEFGEDTAREQLNLIKQNQQKIQQDINESESRISLNDANIRLVTERVNSEISKQNLNDAERAVCYARVQEIATHVQEMTQYIKNLKIQKKLTTNQAANEYIRNRILKNEGDIVSKENAQWYLKWLTGVAMQYYQTNASVLGKML